MADNGTSATDIITYIGVPLAVLGGNARQQSSAFLVKAADHVNSSPYSLQHIRNSRISLTHKAHAPAKSSDCADT